MGYTLCHRIILLLGCTIIGVAAVTERNISHLPDTKFPPNEYSEYSEGERDIGTEFDGQEWEPPVHRRVNSYAEPVPTIPPTLDSNIVWDSKWAANVRFGQISGVSIDPNGNIGVFHRGDRSWGIGAFDMQNMFDRKRGPILENTLVLLDKSGKVLLEWGRDMFYMPHGLTIDWEGNYWLTDVAMHQVFKFDGADIETHKQELSRDRYSFLSTSAHPHVVADLFKNSPIKPSLILGEAFQPGNDNNRFCKPSAVAVQSNGDFFVSDGYCNSRIIKFDKHGNRILHWGRSSVSPLGLQNRPPPNSFLVPHALALAEELDLIFVADRENGRALCFFAGNGTFHKEYQHPSIGGQVFSVAYAGDKLYVVNGRVALYSNSGPPHVRGYVLDIFTGNIVSQFAPSADMSEPHDIAVTADGREIYAVELNTRKIYRFLQDISKLPPVKRPTVPFSMSHGPNISPSNTSDSADKPIKHVNIPGYEIPSTGSSTLLLSFALVSMVLVAASIYIAYIIRNRRKRARMLDDEQTVEYQKLVEETSLYRL